MPKSRRAGWMLFVICVAFALPPSSAAARGGWTPTGSMATARYYHTATLLNDGHVLVAGGYDDSMGYLTSSELYDHGSASWSPTGSMNHGREHETATLLQDGRVLVAGGFDGGHRLASAELYDPAAGTWSWTGRMLQARSRGTATLLPDGRVLLAGGYDGKTY